MPHVPDPHEVVTFVLSNGRQLQMHYDEGTDTVKVFAVGRRQGDLVITPRAGNSAELSMSRDAHGVYDRSHRLPTE